MLGAHERRRQVVLTLRVLKSGAGSDIRFTADAVDPRRSESGASPLGQEGRSASPTCNLQSASGDVSRNRDWFGGKDYPHSRAPCPGADTHAPDVPVQPRGPAFEPSGGLGTLRPSRGGVVLVQIASRDAEGRCPAAKVSDCRSFQARGAWKAGARGPGPAIRSEGRRRGPGGPRDWPGIVRSRCR